MREVDGDSVAVESILLLFLPRQSLLFGLGLGLRHVRGPLRRIRAAAINRVSLSWRHRRRCIRFGAGDALLCLELPHRCCNFLLVLALVRIVLSLHLLLCLEARYLLRICSRRAHGQRTLRGGLLIAAHEAGDGFASGCFGTVVGGF
jgi:hypothetical protein